MISTSKPASPASLAAETRFGRETVPNSGPMKMAARFSVPSCIGVPPFGADEVARPGGDRGEGDLVFLVGLLYAADLQGIENHLDKVLGAARIRVGGARRIEHVLVLIHSQNAMRRKALDSKGAGDADLLVVLVGLVVEVLEVGLGRDGGVDCLLAGDALLPPFGVQVFDCLRPCLRPPRGEFPILANSS